MDKHYLLVYMGSDNELKARQLTPIAASDPVPITKIEYFNGCTLNAAYDPTIYHVFSPLKGTWEDLSYTKIEHNYIARDRNGPCHKFFDTAKTEDFVDLCGRIDAAIIDIVMSTKPQGNAVH